MNVAIGLVILLHGLIHLIGFAHGFGLLREPQFHRQVTPLFGGLWLAAGLIFIAAAGLRIFGAKDWWVLALPAIALSQSLVVRWWPDARFGTLANIVILIPAILAMLAALPGSFHSRFTREAEAGLARNPEDDRHVRVTFKNAGNTIQAVLTIGDDGALIDFVSEDRFQSADGKTYKRYPWLTPVQEYRDYSGYRLASRGRALWRQPEGDFVYGEFLLRKIEFNVAPASAHR